MNLTRSLMGLAALAAVALLFVPGCYYDRTEDMYPPEATCDTTTVTYSGTVAPILAKYCAGGCHSGSSPSGGFPLSTYTEVKDYIDNSGNTFYRSMTQDSTISAMPKGGSKLSDCDLRKIKIWLDAGKPNN
jgi:hypothetical protein